MLREGGAVEDVFEGLKGGDDGGDADGFGNEDGFVAEGLGEDEAVEEGTRGVVGTVLRGVVNGSELEQDGEFTDSCEMGQECGGTA